MQRVLASILTVVASLAALCSCGDESDGPDRTAPTPSSGVTASTDEAPAPAPAPLRQLTAAQLTAALLTLEGLPTGFSETPPEKDSDDGYCGFKDTKADVKVERDFTKGGGFSTEILIAGLAQYSELQVASYNLEALRSQVQRCKTDDLDGDPVTYSVMSTPKVGDSTLGIRIAGESYTFFLNTALVGSTLVTVAGGGVTVADADQVAELFEKQVARYMEVAGG